MSHEEIKRLLESVDLALREIASHLRESRDRERDFSGALVEHRDDFEQFVETALADGATYCMRYLAFPY
jgi:hypothetical protein